MSESVWFEQVDTALVSYIQSKVKLKNASNILTSVPVEIVKPEEDFNSENYPKVSISLTNFAYDKERIGAQPQVVSRDVVHHTLIREKPAEPFKLFYQINFWSMYLSQMGDMLRLWMATCANNFNLPVKDMSNIERSAFAFLVGNIGRNEYVKSGKRLFHTFMTYRLWVEIDEKVTETLPMVTELPEINSGQI